MDLDDLRKRAAQQAGTGNYWAGKVVAVIDQLRQETDEYDQILTRQSQLLTGVSNALKGEPPPLVHWGSHDLPEVAKGLREDVEECLSLLGMFDLYADSAEEEYHRTSQACRTASMLDKYGKSVPHDTDVTDLSREQVEELWDNAEPVNLRSNAPDSRSKGNASDTSQGQTEESS